MIITKALFGALLSLALLAPPGAPRAHAQPAVARFVALPGVLAATEPAPAQRADDKEEPSCRSGKSTRQFGWKVVAFGVSTLKYVIGLLIIPIGLFLVCIGAVLEAVEWVGC